MGQTYRLAGFAVASAFILAAIIVSGCIQQPQKSESYCSTDNDCACGTHITTGACFYGNKAYVNVEKQCPDFCTGIAGNLATKCINNTCNHGKA